MIRCACLIRLLILIGPLYWRAVWWGVNLRMDTKKIGLCSKLFLILGSIVQVIDEGRPIWLFKEKENVYLDNEYDTHMSSKNHEENRCGLNFDFLIIPSILSPHILFDSKLSRRPPFVYGASLTKQQGVITVTGDSFKVTWVNNYHSNSAIRPASTDSSVSCTNWIIKSSSKMN
jgi:hypothetical protein